MADIELPSQVRVGYRTLKIVELHPSSCDAHNRWGVYSSAESKIEVATHLGPVKAANVLLHEILHACFNIGGFQEAEKPSEEAMVIQIADQLSQVWQDNPDVMGWIGQHLIYEAD